jgi:hypothetical protein
MVLSSRNRIVAILLTERVEKCEQSGNGVKTPFALISLVLSSGNEKISLLPVVLIWFFRLKHGAQTVFFTSHCQCGFIPGVGANPLW